MSRTKRIWIVFAACVAALTAALGWVTFVSLRLERREGEARADAQFQESLRLALWRMDSLLAPLVAQEAARPYEQYAATQATASAPNRIVNALQAPATTGFAPLVGYTSEFFRLHFQIGPDGVIASPEVAGRGTDGAAASQPGAVDAGNPSARLAQLRRMVTRDMLLKELAKAEQAGTGEVVVARRSAPAQQAVADRTAQDFLVRQQVANLAWNAFQNQALPATRPGDLNVTQSAFVPVWCSSAQRNSPELLLIRSVTAGRSRVVQGVWADWPRLKLWLLDAIQDVFPFADIKPVLDSTSPPQTRVLGFGTAIEATEAAHPQARMLASIPAVIEVAAIADPRQSGQPLLTPTRITLLVAWMAVLTAVTAVGLVLRAVIVLGERRLQFASAVTHELRTPLTTFRMYSEMLANGMVRDEQTRHEYLDTLTREANRLTNVVENVLLYARVEQRRAATRCEPVAVADLLDRVSDRLSRRAADAQMQLLIDADAARDAVVETDAQAVEQILYNLVDNSCKYAHAAEDRRLHVSVRIAGSGLEMLYYDHGPGIPPTEERQVFEAFRRGSRDAAGTAPGVGLGLALARGLARELGGDLKLVRRTDAGAAFLLSLPL